MDKVLLITRNILKRMFKKPSNFIFYLLLPIAVSIGMFMLFSLEGDDRITIAVADSYNTPLSRSIMDTMNSTNKVNIIEVPQSGLNEHIMSRNASFGYIIPWGFEKNILSGDKPNIDIVFMDNNSGIIWIQEMIDDHIDYLMTVAKASGYKQEELYRLLGSIKKGTISLESINVNDESKVKSTTVRTFGNYMLLLLITTFMIAFRILNEKRLGTFARIGMSPVHPKSYIFANILANLFVTMIQVGVVIITLKYGLGVQFFTSPLMIYFILIIFALCGISVGVLIAAFSKNSSIAGVTLGMVVSPSCMIAGCLWPIEFMPEYMQKIAYITPQRWTLDAINLLQLNNNFVEVLPHLLIVLSFTALFFLIAVYKFKNEDKIA